MSGPAVIRTLIRVCYEHPTAEDFRPNAKIALATVDGSLWCLDENGTPEQLSGGGAEGPAGPEGPQGPPGADGATGPQGPAGAAGPAGPQGATGAQGPQGNTGAQGPQGNAGAQGPQGNQGAQGIQGIQGVQGPAGPNNNVQARLTADRTTTSTTLANVTDMALAIAANETIEFVAHLFCRCNNTGGSQYSVTVPSGATVRASIVGRGATATAINSGEITASGGAGPTVNNANLAAGWCRIMGTVRNGATPGSIQVQHKSVTSGQTTTTFADSTISGRKH